MPDIAPTEIIEIFLESTNNLLVDLEVPASVQILEIAGTQGLAGAPGRDNDATPVYTAAETLSGHMAIALAADGRAVRADCSTPLHALSIVGISEAAAITNADIPVKRFDIIEYEAWTFTPNQFVYLGLLGALVQTLPVSAVFSKVLGIALSSTKLQINIQPAIFIQ